MGAVLCFFSAVYIVVPYVNSSECIALPSSATFPIVLQGNIPAGRVVRALVGRLLCGKSCLQVYLVG